MGYQATSPLATPPFLPSDGANGLSPEIIAILARNGVDPKVLAGLGVPASPIPAAPAPPAAPKPRVGASFAKRLLAALPEMLQGGVDSLATPNLTGGGFADIARGIQSAQAKKQQREQLVLQQQNQEAQIRRQDQASELAQANYLRLIQQQQDQNAIDRDKLKSLNDDRLADNARQMQQLGVSRLQSGMNEDGTERTALSVTDLAKLQAKGGVPISNPEFNPAAIAAKLRFGGSLPSAPASISTMSPLASLTPGTSRPISQGYTQLAGTSGQERFEVPTSETAANFKDPTTFEGAAVRALRSPTDRDTQDQLINRLSDAREKLDIDKTIESALVKAFNDGSEEDVKSLMEIKQKFAAAGGSARAAVPTLSPAALDMAARALRMTGQVPGGSRAAGVIVPIFNTAAGQDPNVDLAGASAAYKGKSQALAQTEKQVANVVPFINNTEFAISSMLEAAKKISDSGIPIVNMTWREAQKRFTNSPELSQFEVFRTTAYTEAAKVLSSANASGAPLSDRARAEVETLLSDDATFEALVAAAQALASEIGNRRKSILEERDSLLQDTSSRSGVTTDTLPGGINFNDMTDAQLRQMLQQLKGGKP